MILDLKHVNLVTAKLGLTIVYRPPFEFDGAWLHAGDKPLIHLQTLQSSSNAAPAERGKIGPLDRHASFEAPEIGVARAALDEKGVTHRAVTSPDGRNHQLCFRDPNGVVIERIARAA